MEELPELKFTEFQKILSKRIITFQIIAMALFSAVTIFLGIILFLYSQGPQQENPERSSGILPILSLVHICMACANYALIFLVPYFFVNKKRLTTAITFSPYMQPQPEMSMEVRACSLIFTGFIMRAALLEGLALFGSIICLMGVLNGEIRVEPAYWLNLFSYVVFAAAILWTFPTKERLEATFQRRFMEQIPIC